MTAPFETDGNVVFINPNPVDAEDFNRAVTNAASAVVSSPVSAPSGKWVKFYREINPDLAPSYRGARKIGADAQDDGDGKPDAGDKRREGSMDPETKTYIDAKTEATRAQNDARFADLRADIATLITKVDAAPTKWTVVAATATILGGTLAFLAFGGDRFDGGLSASSLVVQQKENSRRLDQVDQKLGVILEILGKNSQ